MDQYPLAKYFHDVADKMKIYGKNSDISNEDLLLLYGLFKQSKEGDNNTKQPLLIQIEAKARWKAWNSHKGKNRDLAKHEYVQTAIKYFPEDVRANYV